MSHIAENLEVVKGRVAEAAARSGRKVDLLVGNFSGTIAYFENIGTKNSPQLSIGRMLEADGKTIRVHNW